MRMKSAEAPSDNAVSSVTLTTAVSASNMLIMIFFSFGEEISKVLFSVLGLAAVVFFNLHCSLLTSTTRVKI